MKGLILAAALVVLLPGAPSAADPATLLDEAVAVVNGEVIARSEVVQEARMILVQREGAAGLERQLTPGFMDDVLELLINQRLLLQEAQRSGLEPVTAFERQRLGESFSAQFPGREQYLRFLYQQGISEDEIADVLSRHLMVERMKEYKLRSLPAIKKEDIERYYDENRPQLGGKPLSAVSEAIRLRLLTDQRRNLLSRWLEQLRRQARLRVLVSFGGQQEAGAK